MKSELPKNAITIVVAGSNGEFEEFKQQYAIGSKKKYVYVLDTQSILGLFNIQTVVYYGTYDRSPIFRSNKEYSDFRCYIVDHSVSGLHEMFYHN